MNANLKKLAVVMAAATMAGWAWADSATMEVTASVAAACAVGNGGGIAFGSLTMLNTGNATQTTSDSTANSTFPAICTNGTTLPKFTYESANTTGTDFRLKGVTDNTVFIAYTPYPSADTTGTAIVGGTAVAHPSFAADGTSQSLALSAKILAADKAAKKVQSYSDTITITASFGS